MVEDRCLRCGQEGEDTKGQTNSAGVSVADSGLSGQTEISYYMKADQNSRSASGLVVRNKEGRIVVAKSTLHENIASSFAAEAYVGFQATRLGIQLGYHTLDIIRDSKTVITKCQNANRDRSEIGAIISDIQSLKDYYQEIRFYFIPRLENTETYRLAKETLKKGEEQYLEGGT
ncbi:hypothetical protein Gotri_012999, partial [Gossypium trilobum]|nr:hypothetical protein [Gossypium trilobum]